MLIENKDIFLNPGDRDRTLRGEYSREQIESLKGKITERRVLWCIEGASILENVIAKAVIIFFYIISFGYLWSVDMSRKGTDEEAIQILDEMRGKMKRSWQPLMVAGLTSIRSLMSGIGAVYNGTRDSSKGKCLFEAVSWFGVSVLLCMQGMHRDTSPVLYDQWSKEITHHTYK